MREWETDRSVPVEPSGSRLRQCNPPERRGAVAVSQVAGTVGHAPNENLRHALSAEENQHSMTMFSTRWSHGLGSTRRNRDVHRQEVTR